MSRTVRDIMTTDVVSVSLDTSFKEVARLMVAWNVSSLPVVEGERLVGIVSESDVLHKEEFAPASVGEEYHDSLRARLRRGLGGTGSAQAKARAGDAGGLMTRKVITVGPEESVVNAARTMDRCNVKQLPVVDERGHLIGLLSRHDMLRVFARSDEEIEHDIEVEFAAAPVWLLDTRAVRVSVDDGTVTVEGRVEQHSSCTMIIQLIRGVDGVVGVHSKLTWNIDDMLPPRSSYAP